MNFFDILPSVKWMKNQELEQIQLFAWEKFVSSWIHRHYFFFSLDFMKFQNYIK